MVNSTISPIDKLIRESQSVSFISRVLFVYLFFSSMMLATVFVSVVLLGKYTIAYIPDIGRMFLSFLFVMLLALSLPSNVNRIDRLLVWLLVLFSGVPILIPYALGNARQEWMYVSLVFWVLIGIQSKIELSKMIVFPRIRGGWLLLGLFFGIVVAYSLYTAIFVVGLTFTFNFSDVYDVREIYLEKQIPLGNYTYKWTVFIVAPLLFFIGVWQKRYLLMVAGGFIALILFFATGHKTYLLAVPFVYGLYWVLRRKYPIQWITVALSIMILAGIGSYNLTGDARLNASFLNRIFVLPAKISYEYHDYFTERSKIYLSHSIFSSFVEYPYNEKPAELIATSYYDNPDGYPNTGMVADAFMNFGYSGVVALFMLVTIIFRLVVFLSAGKPTLLVLSLLTMPVYSWVNSGFFTSFLTSGLLLSLIGIWLLPKNKSLTHEARINVKV